MERFWNDVVINAVTSVVIRVEEVDRAIHFIFHPAQIAGKMTALHQKSWVFECSTSFAPKQVAISVIHHRDWFGGWVLVS